MVKTCTPFIAANDLDERTIAQFNDCIKEPYVVDAALMPDAHSGYVAPIGSVLVTKGFVVPSWVGYDIGCGVTAVRLHAKDLQKNILENRDEIYKEVQKVVPMGLGKLHNTSDIHRESIETFNNLLKILESRPHDPEVLSWIKKKALPCLGTLGEGNHFLELGFATDEFSGADTDEAWIIVHSGSRNVGHKVAEKYMKKSSGKEQGFEETHPLDVKSQMGQEYLAMLDFGLEFALLNRLEMAKSAIEAIETIVKQKIEFVLWTNKNHNHAIPKRKLLSTVYVHRKGATPAKRGEKGVIPGNMRDGCYLVVGKGNKKFLESSSHGAGRKMSRSAAKKSISMKDFKDSMQGITGTIAEGTLDEAPDAYKNISKVMDLQKESVLVLSHIKPVINWKGDVKSKLDAKRNAKQNKKKASDSSA
ncbi:MAG: RtcB family protein [Candidatus Woesearchaeota archaeon]